MSGHNININNKSFMDRLNAISDEFFSYENYEDERYYAYDSPEGDHFDNGEYYCGDIALQEKLSKWEDHSGFPEEHFAQPISKMVQEDPEIWTPFRDRVKFDFARELGAHTSALLSYYPPGGFVGWHTNWNANAYQVLFTYSETGDSYFRYYDKLSGDIVTLDEKPGWQCHHYYFGRKDEEDHHCWHSAYAGCRRITLAYKFVNGSLTDIKNDQAIQLRDMLIEEIEDEGF